MIEETHPGIDGFVTPPSVREPIAAEEYMVEPTYPTTVASVSNAEQFNYPPYVSPESVAPTEEVIHIAPTKPPVSNIFTISFILFDINFRCLLKKMFPKKNMVCSDEICKSRGDFFFEILQLPFEPPTIQRRQSGLARRI